MKLSEFAKGKDCVYDEYSICKKCKKIPPENNYTLFCRRKHEHEYDPSTWVKKVECVHVFIAFISTFNPKVMRDFRIFKKDMEVTDQFIRGSKIATVRQKEHKGHVLTYLEDLNGLRWTLKL